MNAKWLVWLLIGLVWSVGIVALTAMGIMPTEVAAGLGGVAITAIFGEVRYEANDKSWAQFYEQERIRWANEKDAGSAV